MSNGYVLTFVFFNVGQGNSILIVLPPDEESAGERRYGVIDCYYDKYKHAEPPVLTYLKNHRATCLEFIILTHADRDHFFGLSQLVEYFSSEERSFKLFIESPIRCGDAAYNKYYSPEIEGDGLTDGEINTCFNELKTIHEMTFGRYDDLRRKGKSPSFQYHSIFKAYKGIQLTHDLKATILSPCEDNILRVRRDIMDNMTFAFEHDHLTSRNLPKRINCNIVSLAMKLEYGDSTLLICGDVLNPEWFRIIGDFKNCREKLVSDFINVGHHGSSGGNPRKLWSIIARKDAKRKSLAVISCGYSSRHHHPSESTLNQIFANNVELYCINKGYPCRDFEVVRPLEIAIQRVCSSGYIQQAILNLQGKEEICSGECIFSVGTSGDVRLLSREQDAFCAYRKYKFRP